MIIKLRQKVTRNLLNIPGWRTKRKIVVIESDDWGSIRMASKEAFNYFLSLGYPVDQCNYNKYDALESNDDLELLYEVLSSVKDKCGNPAVITANSLVANPDFERIKASLFQDYYFERVTETLQRYPNHDRVYKLVKEGIEHKVFRPQFHGREHLNVPRWMSALQQGDKAALEAFGQSMFSVHSEVLPTNKFEFMDALDCDSPEHLAQLSGVLTEGLKIFKHLWGYDSKSFIANCYVWSRDLEPILNLQGVHYLQGVVYQREPVPEKGYKYKHIYHYQGQGNSNGQRYLVRNSFFEPTHAQPGFDAVADCLKRINAAFYWGKPAIISSHRLNFIGFIVPENRDKNLKLLQQLLNAIVAKWPDVEFITSDQLGDIINGQE
jgi:hypothetical protein